MAKSIKLKNEIYIDSKTIVHQKKVLNEILDHFLYHYDMTTEIDLNHYIEKGLYHLSKTYQHSPKNEVIYGILIVITSRNISWTPQDMSNWIWQIILTTNEEIFMRTALNTTTFSNWKKLS